MWRKAQTIISVVIQLMLSGCATMVDRLITGTYVDPPYKPNVAAARLHQKLMIVDLHADPLLWNRDLLERASHGHVDVPRLQEGNVGLQIFGVVNGVPFPLKMENNVDRWDVIGLLARLQDWPQSTYDSRLQRALYQAAKLAERARSSAGALTLITNRQELEALLAARQRGERIIGAMLSLEGTQALEGDPANIELLFEAGFRMLGLAHLFDNAMAGSAHGKDKYGLTEKGREMIQRALAHRMIIDLAHASPQTIDDVLAIVDRPVVASHGGVRGTCDSVRNLSDRHIRGIAKTGGVMGIGIYKYATCGKTLEDTVRAMRYVADLVGVEHVALGTDFDGAVTVVDASGLVMLTQALLQAKFTEDEIAAIMGGNALRVFRQTLP
ncbi:MAG: dipeptidase [Proteobacteria bacterium]|nr:dipeptidase [Pseudomonadota bacterium]